MTKLNIASIPGVVKRSPNSLKRWFRGDNYNHYTDLSSHKNIDAYIQTNLIKQKFYQTSRINSYEHILRSQKPKLVMESSMFRGTSIRGLLRLGWNSYQHHEADFNNKDSDGDRWKLLQQKYGMEVSDWKANGEYVLFLLQKPGDSSLLDISLDSRYKDYWDWVSKTVVEIRKNTDRKIIIRPHINQQDISYNNSARISKTVKNCFVSENYKWKKDYGSSGGEGLQNDLSNAWCAVTYNSLSGVESVLSGTPLIALHQGSMAYPVAHKNLSQIETLNRNLDITQWLYDSAYTCWSSVELSRGEAWERLRPRYNYWVDQTKKNYNENIYKLEKLINKWSHQ